MLPNYKSDSLVSSSKATYDIIKRVAMKRVVIDVHSCARTHRHTQTHVPTEHACRVFMITPFLTNQALLFAPNEDGGRNYKLGIGV